MFNEEVRIVDSTGSLESGMLFTLTKEDVERNVEEAKMIAEMLSEGYFPVFADEKERQVEKIGVEQMPWEWNPYWSPTPIDPADPNLQPKSIIE
jgi:hypothetical protein